MFKQIACIAWLCTSAAAFAAESYPSRPIRLIVPFSAGGGADIIARLLGSGMAKGLNAQFVIDNRPGAGTVLGTDLAAHSNADGYTLVLVATAHATNPGLVAKLPFDPMNDFAPITLAVDTPLIVVVPTSLPVANLRELIELAKSKPQRIIYGSAGRGAVVFTANGDAIRQWRDQAAAGGSAEAAALAQRLEKQDVLVYEGEGVRGTWNLGRSLTAAFDNALLAPVTSSRDR
jgi:tripartite-type tricarboxylate transporter receptor subunit TctC